MVTHKGTKKIKTERLHLRKYVENDVNDIFNNYATDKRVTKFLSWQPYNDKDVLKTFIATQISNYQDDVYNWVIKYEGHVVGSISVVRADEKNQSCEIGYCLGHDYWNNGITSEAMMAILNFLFKEVGYHRIFAKHDIENPASGKVMIKCNMIFEGRLREHYLRHDGTYSDSMMYSILKNEFLHE